MMYTAIYNANSPSRCSVEFVNCTPRVFLLLSSPFFFNTEPAIGCRDDDGSVAITAAGLEEQAPSLVGGQGEQDYQSSERWVVYYFLTDYIVSSRVLKLPC